MRTCQNGPNGFTLLELLICLLIIGALLGAGLGLFQPVENSLKAVAREFANLCSQARIDAILTKKKIELLLEGRSLYENDSSSRNRLFSFPADFELSVDNKSPLKFDKTSLVYSPLGFTQERVIHLRKDKEFCTIYLPAIGAPVIFSGLLNMDEILKEQK